jgi:hypothetical protein
VENLTVIILTCSFFICNCWEDYGYTSSFFFVSPVVSLMSEQNLHNCHSNMYRKLTKEQLFLLKPWWKKSKKSQEVIAAVTEKFPRVQPPTRPAIHNVSARYAETESVGNYLKVADQVWLGQKKIQNNWKSNWTHLCF